MAAPIDTFFLFREKEIEIIDTAFQKVDIVMLTGAAGTGKTRLGLQYAVNHPDVNKENLFFVHKRM